MGFQGLAESCQGHRGRELAGGVLVLRVWGGAVLPHVHMHVSVPEGIFVPVCLHLCVHLQTHM